MKRCRFCGGKILDDASQCQHCGKTLSQPKSEPAGSPGLTNLDSWEKKSVPPWVMYVVVAFFGACLVFLIIKGCEPSTEDENASRLIYHSNHKGSASLDVPHCWKPAALARKTTGKTQPR